MRAARANRNGRLHGNLSLAGLAAALLAAWSQIVLLATITLGAPLIVADPLTSYPICHADSDDPAQPPKQTPSHGTHDCTLCAICLARIAPPTIVPATQLLHVRSAIVGVRYHDTQPRAPPIHWSAAAQPRGPPFLV